MTSLQDELNSLFEDQIPDDDEPVKPRRGAKPKPPKPPKKEKPPKPEPFIKQPFIKVKDNNESKWFNVIQSIAKRLDGRHIVDVYGNSGLICYWLKRMCPTAVITYNDSQNITSKYSAEVLDKYFNGIEITHNEPESYLNEEPNAIYLLNPKSFDILQLEFLIRKVNVLVFGNSSNPSTDTINVYNRIIKPLVSEALEIPHDQLKYCNEHDYLLVDIDGRTTD